MKSTLKAKLQRAYSKTHSMFALTLFMFFISWIPASQAACSLHDHFCSYHVGGATVTAGAAANTGTSLVMYATATNPGTTTASTVDFDTLGKMPANTGDRFLVGSPINYTTPTGPYIVNSTAYGTTHPPTTWSTPGDAVLQVAPSQYQLTFNQNTAIAKHTGDFNGGENGNIPGATGCPNMPAGTKNCEAVVVTGNVPNGIYEQKVTLFNYFNAPNPQVQLQVGAYTTGRAVIISNSHESKEQAYFPILSGTGATTPAYQYEVYNLGFDPHAKGTALFDQNKYSTRYSNTYEAGDHRFRDAYFTTLTTHNKVNADGWNDKTYTAKTSVEKQYMGAVPKPPVPTVFCTDGKSSISCGTPGAVEYGSAKGRALENAYATLWADQAQKQAAVEKARYIDLPFTDKRLDKQKLTWDAYVAEVKKTPLGIEMPWANGSKQLRTALENTAVDQFYKGLTNWEDGNYARSVGNYVAGTTSAIAKEVHQFFTPDDVLGTTLTFTPVVGKLGRINNTSTLIRSPYGVFSLSDEVAYVSSKEPFINATSILKGKVGVVNGLTDDILKGNSIIGRETRLLLPNGKTTIADSVVKNSAGDLVIREYKFGYNNSKTIESILSDNQNFARQLANDGALNANFYGKNASDFLLNFKGSLLYDVNWIKY